MNRRRFFLVLTFLGALTTTIFWRYNASPDLGKSIVSDVQQNDELEDIIEWPSNQISDTEQTVSVQSTKEPAQYSLVDLEIVENTKKKMASSQASALSQSATDQQYGKLEMPREKEGKKIINSQSTISVQTTTKVTSFANKVQPTTSSPSQKNNQTKESTQWTSEKIFDSQMDCAPAMKNSLSNASPSDMSCRLPVLDPFHPSIMKFVTKTSYPECPGKEHGKLVNGKFKFTDDVLSATYRSITRNGDFAVKFGESKPLSRDQPITDEFLEVEFKLKDGATSKEFFLQVVPRENLLNRRPKKPPGIPLNILIIGVDSLSHAGAKRKLPKIYEFLRKDLDSYIFEGHTVTGDGTTQQLTPMLTGRKFSEQYEARAGFTGARTLDDWTWIYKQLTDHGYVTGHSEDSIEYGPFHYRLKGYTNQPTDLYTRPFFERVKPLNKGRPNLCLNSKNIARYQFDYVRSVFERLPDQLKFFFSFNGGHGHHGINIVQKIEWDFLDLLREIKARGYLNNTLLIVMGDHGLRFGQVRESIQGKLEERLPLFSMTFPPWFKSRYPKLAATLKTNTKRLTSWFDVYATFRHMLSYPDLPSDLKHGQSLLTEVPKSRTCAEASIPEHWCPCLEWSAVSAQHSHVSNSALAAVQYINSLNEEKDKSRKLCEKLSLKKVNYGMLEMPNKRVLQFSDVGFDWKTNFNAEFKGSQAHTCNYQVQFVTAPSNGVYEATIKFVRGKFAVNIGISRVNMYGSQPKCVADEFPHLRKFCFCRNSTKS